MRPVLARGLLLVPFHERSRRLGSASRGSPLPSQGSWCLAPSHRHWRVFLSPPHKRQTRACSGSSPLTRSNAPRALPPLLPAARSLRLIGTAGQQAIEEGSTLSRYDVLLQPHRSGQPSQSLSTDRRGQHSSRSPLSRNPRKPRLRVSCLSGRSLAH